jgi:hypothetical protein
LRKPFLQSRMPRLHGRRKSHGALPPRARLWPHATQGQLSTTLVDDW